MQTAYDKARDFLLTQQTNENLNASQYYAYDKFTTDLWWSWENWEDEVTREFWRSDEKPTSPTQSFIENYISNMTDEELAPIIEAFDFEDFFYYLQITESDIRRDIETLIGDGFPPRTEPGVTGWAEFCRTNYEGFDSLNVHDKEELYQACEAICLELE